MTECHLGAVCSHDNVQCSVCMALFHGPSNLHFSKNKMKSRGVLWGAVSDRKLQLSVCAFAPGFGEEGRRRWSEPPSLCPISVA